MSWCSLLFVVMFRHLRESRAATVTSDTYNVPTTHSPGRIDHQAAQLVEATLPGGTNAALRDVQHPDDLVVAERRVDAQQPQQGLARRRELVEGLTERGQVG